MAHRTPPLGNVVDTSTICITPWYKAPTHTHAATHGITEIRMFVAPNGTRRTVVLGPHALVEQLSGDGGGCAVIFELP